MLQMVEPPTHVECKTHNFLVNVLLNLMVYLGFEAILSSILSESFDQGRTDRKLPITRQRYHV